MAADQEREPVQEHDPSKGLDIQRAIFDSELYWGSRDDRFRSGAIPPAVDPLILHDPESGRPPIMRVVRKDGRTKVTFYPDTLEIESDQQKEE